MPPEASTQTAAGAEAFARHFWAQSDYTIATGDIAPLAALSGPTCIRCEIELQVVKTTRMMGGRWEKTAVTISDVQISEGHPPGPVDLIFIYSVGEMKVFDMNGVTIEMYPGSTGQRSRLSLVPNGQSWLVSDYGAVVT